MTLIMNNLGLSMSIFAMTFSLLTLYLRYRAEKIDRGIRRKKLEEMRVIMAESYFDYGKWDNS